MKFRFWLFFLLWTPLPALAQEKKMVTISGYVREANTGESMLGAGVYLKELLKGTYTNAYGFYSITVPEGTYTLVASFVGYTEFRDTIRLTGDLLKNISLAALAIETGEVVVIAEK